MKILGRDSSEGSFPRTGSGWSELPVWSGREFLSQEGMRRHMDGHLTAVLCPLGHWTG